MFWEITVRGVFKKGIGEKEVWWIVRTIFKKEAVGPDKVPMKCEQILSIVLLIFYIFNTILVNDIKEQKFCCLHI